MDYLNTGGGGGFCVEGCNYPFISPLVFSIKLFVLFWRFVLIFNISKFLMCFVWVCNTIQQNNQTMLLWLSVPVSLSASSQNHNLKHKWGLIWFIPQMDPFIFHICKFDHVITFPASFKFMNSFCFDIHLSNMSLLFVYYFKKLSKNILSCKL